jgi:hypothetical protein
MASWIVASSRSWWIRILGCGPRRRRGRLLGGRGIARSVSPRRLRCPASVRTRIMPKMWWVLACCVMRSPLMIMGVVSMVGRIMRSCRGPTAIRSRIVRASRGRRRRRRGIRRVLRVLLLAGIPRGLRAGRLAAATTVVKETRSLQGLCRRPFSGSIGSKVVQGGKRQGRRRSGRKHFPVIVRVAVQLFRSSSSSSSTLLVGLGR